MDNRQIYDRDDKICITFLYHIFSNVTHYLLTIVLITVLTDIFTFFSGVFVLMSGDRGGPFIFEVLDTSVEFIILLFA